MKSQSTNGTIEVMGFIAVALAGGQSQQQRRLNFADVPTGVSPEVATWAAISAVLCLNSLGMSNACQ